MAAARKQSITGQSPRRSSSKPLNLDPKKEVGENAQASRDLQAANVIMCRNLVSDSAFVPQEEARRAAVQEFERAGRLLVM